MTLAIIGVVVVGFVALVVHRCGLVEAWRCHRAWVRRNRRVQNGTLR